MKTATDDLPEGWDETPLIDLLSALESGSRPKGGVREIATGIPSIGGEHLDAHGGFRFEKLKFVPATFYKSMTRGHIHRGDVLVVKDGATTGKVSLVREDFPHDPAVVNEHVFACRPSREMSPEFLFRFLFSADGQERILEHFRGAAQGGITQQFASGTLVPVAPIAEQRRIVAKVEELLAQVNQVRERLARVPVILKRFRQSILSAVCSGRLTEDWRAQHLDCGTLESARKHTALSDLCRRFEYGSAQKSQPEGKIPVLRMGNLQDGEIDWTDLVYTSDPDEIRQFSLKPNTVLFNRTNSPALVGKTAIYRGGQPAIFAGYLIRIHNGDTLNAEYLNYCLNEQAFREYCAQTRTDGVNQSNINATKLSAYALPYCDLREQREIVRRVKELFKQADDIERQVEAATKRVEKLTQAILAKAFRGELVPTEAELARKEGRSYEPASVLLDRIRQERVSSARRQKG